MQTSCATSSADPNEPPLRPRRARQYRRTPGRRRASSSSRAGRSPDWARATRGASSSVTGVIVTDEASVTGAFPERSPVRRPVRTCTVLADQAPTEAERHCLSPVVDAELAEQPAGVGLDGVLGQVEVTADLVVRLALTHPGKDLQLALGELRPRRDAPQRLLARERATQGRLDQVLALQCVRNSRAQLLVADVLEQVAPGAVRHRGRDLVAVVGRRQHDDLGVRVLTDEPAGRLEAAETGHPHVHEHEVRALVRVAREHLLAACRGVDAVDAGDAGDELPQTLPHDAVVVADEHGGGHGVAFVRGRVEVLRGTASRVLVPLEVSEPPSARALSAQRSTSCSGAPPSTSRTTVEPSRRSETRTAGASAGTATA